MLWRKLLKSLIINRHTVIRRPVWENKQAYTESVTVQVAQYVSSSRLQLCKERVRKVQNSLLLGFSCFWFREFPELYVVLGDSVIIRECLFHLFVQPVLSRPQTLHPQHPLARSPGGQVSGLRHVVFFESHFFFSLLSWTFLYWEKEWAVKPYPLCPGHCNFADFYSTLTSPALFSRLNPVYSVIQTHRRYFIHLAELKTTRTIVSRKKSVRTFCIKTSVWDVGR